MAGKKKYSELAFRLICGEKSTMLMSNEDLYILRLEIMEDEEFYLKIKKIAEKNYPNFQTLPLAERYFLLVEKILTEIEVEMKRRLDYLAKAEVMEGEGMSQEDFFWFLHDDSFLITFSQEYLIGANN
jgi:hypothetical protein